MPSLSTGLEDAIRGAIQLANERRHTLATIEHILLTLTSEPDTEEVLISCGARPERLRARLTRFIDEELNDLKAEGEEDVEAASSTEFQRVIQRAAIHVQSAGKEEVRGSNVLAAIFNERESASASILAEENISRSDVVKYISHGSFKAAAKDDDAPPPIKIIPQQEERAFRFERQTGYPIGYRRIRPDLGKVNRHKQEQICKYLRDDLEEFSAACPEHSNSLRVIRSKIDDYLRILGNDFLSINILRLWKAGNDLRVELRKDRKRQENPDPDVNPLKTEFSEKLSSIVALHNVLSSGDNVLSELDNTTIDPVDRIRMESSRSELGMFIGNLAKAPNVVENEVPTDLLELLNESMANSPSSDRSLSIVDDSANNLAREILREALIEAKTGYKTNKTLSGVRVGAEQAVGATAVAGALGTAGIGFSYFVKLNEALLHNLISGWFGQSHTLHQVIQWIAKFAPF